MAPPNGSNGSSAFIDPKMLLNPRAGAKRPAPQNDRSNSNAPLFSSPVFDANGCQYPTMIERMHNVEARSYAPAKRTHVSGEIEDQDDNKKKSKMSANVSSGGEIGQYLKEQRQQGFQTDTRQPSKGVVDLTEDDDMEVVYSNIDTLPKPQKPDPEDMVCLGYIEGARVNAHMVPNPKHGGVFNKLKWMPMKVNLLRRPGSTCIIGVTDPAGKDFGSIDVRIAGVMAQLLDNVQHTHLRIDARLEMRDKEPYEHPGQLISKSLAIAIVLYAKRKYTDGIGRIFGQRNIWLREPQNAVDRRIEIVCPHSMTKGSDPGLDRKKALANRTKYTTTGQAVRSVEQVRSDVMRIFDQIKDSKTLPTMEADPRIKTNLLHHQKQALYFMRQREEHDNIRQHNEESLWQEDVDKRGRRYWMHVITSHTMSVKPEVVRGGILADVMGLGKTLNVLALISFSTDKAVEFSRLRPPPPQFQDDALDLVYNCKATLLVCPLSTIANWEEQIRTHFHDDGRKLKYTIYHGPNRTQDCRDFEDKELVITSYTTIAADFDRRSIKRPNNPMAQVNWFRIVLDEAHTIRESTTRQAQVIYALAADRRWAVTGTPVQNRLNDFGSLIRFLRIRPFDESRNFVQYIIAPFKNGDYEIIPQLRLLVDSITLRRNKDMLSLPKRDEYLVSLEMSQDERHFYDFYAKQSQNKVDAIIKNREKLGGSSYAHVLKAITRLRLLCAHGEDLLSDSDFDASKGYTASNAIDLEDNDDEDNRTPRQGLEMYRMICSASQNICVVCNEYVVHQEIQDEEPEETDGHEDIFAYLSPCNHLICSKHADEYKKGVQRNIGPDNHGSCHICNSYIRLTLLALKQSEYESDERARREMKKNPRLARAAGRYSGPHTKTKNLLAYLQQDIDCSEQHPDEAPIKSVIFSQWTSHLDLIQIALTEVGIRYVRLDGSMSRKARGESLETFSSNPSVTCILISIMAGGMGINLTTASRVYVMEPQFNPAAESQAIERVHRLGQKRDVIIRKMIMKNSFEEKMIQLQKKKIKLAEMSLERNHKIDKAETAKERMNELRSLFK